MGTRVAFLWHMHQPMYVEPATGEAILPWVRFHATHAYYDMGRMLERHPDVRVTVNFVPCLIEQLDAAAHGTLRERYLEMTRRRPEDMSAEERLFVVRQFFMVDREKCIKPLPRYWELLRRRGEDATRIDPDLFTDGDVRDIQLLFNLVWMGFSARADEPSVAALLAKGRDFDENDKSLMLAAQQRVVQRVLPLWKRLADSGQVELSSTPYFHPILPLLCDSNAARRSLPDSALPPRFSHPEDAHLQVRRAISRHQAAFGSIPTGMWPAEGSVSPEALEVFQAEGVRWVASDEAVLFRSAPAPAGRGALYQAWSCDVDGHSIALAFRDRALSDRIGFTYARMKADDATADFLTQIRRADSEARRAGIADPLIPVILDGENAWEHYEGAGEPFLNALYGALAQSPDFTTATMSEALAHPTGRLTRIHSGSWIESSYRIWIGHPEDNLAWELLGRVRAMLTVHEARGDIDPTRLEQARNLLLSAEGSDWFWWYGDDFDTDNAAEFDLLFRDRLLRAAALLGESPPPRLNEPISQQARRQRSGGPLIQSPGALLSPRLDGLATSFIRWLGAGVFRPGGGQGAMFHGTRFVSELRFGSDLEKLYLRLEFQEPIDDLSLWLTVSNGRSSERELAIPLQRGRLNIPLPGATGVCEEVVELALPLAGLHLLARDRVQLTLRLLRGGVELERIPTAAPISFEVPDADFESRAWFV